SDNMLTNMGRRARAIGFAVYMDELERLGAESDGYDCDVLLLYDACRDNCSTVLRMTRQITAGGETVRAACADNGTIRYRRIIDLTKEAPSHG
ncbi:MAG: hypothetical protein IJY28_08940, partial [Clostridia bacterium]|nr:hypothetical protein [Clostridia bacterium]